MVSRCTFHCALYSRMKEITVYRSQTYGKRLNTLKTAFNDPRSHDNIYSVKHSILIAVIIRPLKVTLKPLTIIEPHDDSYRLKQNSKKNNYSLSTTALSIELLVSQFFSVVMSPSPISGRHAIELSGCGCLNNDLYQLKKTTPALSYTLHCKNCS